MELDNGSSPNLGKPKNGHVPNYAKTYDLNGSYFELVSILSILATFISVYSFFI